MINVIKADITNLNVDIVVNAANTSLLGGGGVDGAIHKKAGKGLLEECKKLNGCHTGEAKITNGYNMPCKKIIHTVGPIYHNGNSNESTKLKNCYLNSMLLAEEYRINNNLNNISIAFPCISTGIYHYPKKEAASIAVNTINEINNPNIDVYFVCFENTDYEVYQELLNNITK